MEIEVKQYHINKGEPKFCDSCAIALALKEVFPTAKDIQVQDPNDIRIDRKKIKVVNEDFSKVRKFLHYFDSEFKVEPIKFSLNL